MEKQDFGIIMHFMHKMLPDKCPDLKDGSVIEYWHKRLASYGPERLKMAAETAVDSLDFFPSFAKFKSILEGDTKPRGLQAKEIGEQILYCLKRYGWDRASREAHKDLCEVGQEVVRREGGWGAISDKVVPSNESFMKKEWSALAEAILIDKGTINSGQKAITSEDKRHPMIESEIKKLTDGDDDKE